jgi:parvulin-like peptidyl-prolyl isomerase
MRYLATALLLALLVPSGCSLPKDTAAEVNGRQIPAAELEAEYQKFITEFGQAPPGLEPVLPTVRRTILDRLITRELQLEEAEKRGIRPTATEIDHALIRAREGMQDQELDASLAEAGTDRERWRRSVERDLVIEKLQQAVTASVQVTDRDVAEWLAQHRDRGEHPEEVRASQILVHTREEALEARRRILGGAAFSTVAREVSLSPDAVRGGDLGYFSRGQMPAEFDEVAFTLPPGQVSDVVDTAYGYHLFLVTDRRPARARSQAEIGGEARAALLAERKDAAFRAWMKEIRAKARIRHNAKAVPQ